MSEFLKNRVPVPLYTQSAPRPLTEDTEGDESEVGFTDAFSSAFLTVNTLRGVGGALTEANFQTDHNYRLDLNDKLKDVPEQQQPFMASMLEDARSEEHADWLLDRAADEFEAINKVQEYTGGSIWGNLGMLGLASITDPVNLATLAIGVPLSAAKTAEKLTRVQRAARVAGFEAVLNAAIEVPLVAGNPTAESTDILWAAMFGGVLGGGIGAIGYKSKRGSLAKKQGDQLTEVANKSLDDMANAEAHTLANKEADLIIDPPEDLYTMAPDVRRDASQKATPNDKDYEPTETLNAQRAADQQKLETVTARELPDEPTPVRGAEAADEFLDELNFIKSVQRGDVKLSTVERTRADAEFQKAKRQFIADFREAHPDKAKEIFGASRNPKMEAIEDALPRVKKALAASEKKAKKAKKDYEAALEKRGVEKDVLLERIAVLDTKLAARAAAPDLGHSAGAAQAEKGGIDLSKVSEEEFDEMYDIPTSRQNRIPGTEQATRFDMAGVVDRSPNQAVRVAGAKVFQDAQPKVDHAVNPESASELAEWMRDVTLGIYDAVAKPAFKAWLKEQGHSNNILARALDWDGKMRSAFEEEVMQAVKDGAHASPNVMEAAGAMSDAYKRAFDYAVETKLPGFEDLKYDKNYTPRRTSHQKIMHLNSDYSISMKGNKADSPLGELYYRAMMEANPTYDPALTLRIANKIAKREVQRATSVSYDMPDFGAMTREKLDELFDAIDMTDVDRQNFFDGLDQQFAQPDAGRVSHAKHRMDLEVDHTPIEATYTGSSIPGGMQHGDVVPLTLNDMMETRGDILLHGYVNDLVGWGSLNKVTNGKVHNPSSLKKWMEELNEYEQTFVMDPKRTEPRGIRRSSAIEGELKYLQIGINHTLGRAVDPGDDIMAGTRRFLNGWNFLRVMNQTIFPQMSESSKIITSTSLETFNHYVPAMKDLVNAIRTGAELTPAQQKLSMAAREIGLGTNVVRGGVVTRHQTDLDGSLFTKTDKKAARMAHLKKVTARPLQATMDVQEVLTSTSLQAEMAMRAKGLKTTSAADMKRLAWMGIDKKHLERINKQIMKYALDENGQPYSASGSKWIGDLQMSKWDDAVARDKFGFGLKRRVGEVIQTNNIGNLPRFAVSDIGAMLVQFRTFPIAAWNKQLMHHLSYNDANAYLTFAVNSAFASGFYAMQKGMASIGREDAQEYRDKALTPKNLAFAAWERSAWGSMTPAIGDVVSMVAQGQVMNPYSTRTTGLGKLTAGVPAIDLVEKGAKAFSSTTGLLHKDRNFKKAFKEAYALAPFYNFLGLQNAANAFAATLPDDK